jgi:hypothetical protein
VNGFKGWEIDVLLGRFLVLWWRWGWIVWLCFRLDCLGESVERKALNLVVVGIINQRCRSMGNGSMLYGMSLLVYIGHNGLKSCNRLQHVALVQLLQIR